MRATGDIAAEKFERFVGLANGASYLVYQALTSLKNPTDKDVEEYIKTHGKVESPTKINLDETREQSSDIVGKHFTAVENGKYKHIKFCAEKWMKQIDEAPSDDDAFLFENGKNADIVRRLRGVVRVPIEDNMGAVESGGAEDYFERIFPSTIAAKEAADYIERLRGRIHTDKCQYDEYTTALINEFKRLKEEAPNLRDMIYLDAVMAVISTLGKQHGIKVE